MITGLEKQTGPLKGLAWALATGNAELLRQWKTLMGQVGKAARGQGSLLRSEAQMLERQAETLRMTAWPKQTEPPKSMDPITQPTQNQWAG